MIDLSTVVSAINERSLRLYRKADSIRVEGDCPPELAEAISTHQVSLMPFVAVDPAAAEQVVEQQAIADCNDIRQQLDDFAEWLFKEAGWAAIDPQWSDRIDRRIAEAVDSQEPHRVSATIASLRKWLESVNFALDLFPCSFECEAKHAAESGASGIGDAASDDETPF